MSVIVRPQGSNTLQRSPTHLMRALLTGAGQVMFQESPFTGAFFLAGILVASVPLGIAALLGLIASTVTAMMMGAPSEAMRRGLYGYNGILVGLALAVFLRADAWLVAYIMLGGALSTLLTATCNAWLGKHELPVLTAPFVLTTWLLLLAAFLFSRIQFGELASPALPQLFQEVHALASLGSIGEGVLTGVGQVMLINNVWTGVLFTIGLVIGSLPAAMLALLGSLLGVVTGVALGGPADWAPVGLYGFNGALVAIALGSVFQQPTISSFVYGSLGAIMSTIVFVAMVTLLQPVGMPAFTMPFILTTWVFLLAIRYLKEVS